MCLAQQPFFMASKTDLFLMATTRASLRASCMTLLQKIPDNLNFNNSKKSKMADFCHQSKQFLKGEY